MEDKGRIKGDKGGKRVAIGGVLLVKILNIGNDGLIMSVLYSCGKPKRGGGAINHRTNSQVKKLIVGR